MILIDGSEIREEKISLEFRFGRVKKKMLTPVEWALEVLLSAPAERKRFLELL